MKDPENPVSRIVVCGLLALLVGVAFWPVLGNDFVGLDDERYVTGNPHVQEGDLVWAWSSSHAANWHPLAWLSHMLDWRLFGPDATGHHLSSLLLHAANTCLLFLLLQRLTGAAIPAGLVALLFGLHPLHVESVAWVAERKDVLCTLFWFLAIGAYARWVRAPGLGGYLRVVLAAVAALCAKPMAVTLPFTLLLLDYWPLKRIGTWQDLGRAAREKIPLFALSAASAVVTVVVQRAGDAVAPLEHYSLGVRAANALVAYATYAWKTFWPAGLALPYPHPGATLSAWTILVSIVVLLAVTAVVVRLRRKHPYLLFGWLWFGGTLVPVIGLLQVGQQAMADRYTYVPLIGLFVMIAWGIPSAVGPTASAATKDDAKPQPVRRSTGLLAVTFLLVPVLTVATWTQLRHWKNAMSLATRAIAVTRHNAVAHNQLGLELTRRGNAAAGLPHLQQAVEIRPRFAEAHNNLGGAHAALGNRSEAIEWYRKALQLNPDYPEALLNLGVALAGLDRFDEAIEAFEDALRSRPGYGKAHANLAAVHFTRGEVERARQELDLARRSGFEPPPDLVRAIEGARPSE